MAATTNQEYFRHRFDKVTDYLHHRPPYLLVDEVLEIGEDSIKTQSTVDSEAFFVQGHFPGAPILPGALMHEMTTQTAGVLIAANYNPMPEYNTHDPDFNEFALGVLVKTKQGRYRGFARPGDTLEIFVELIAKTGDLFEFKGRIHKSDGTRIYQNQFQLTNVPSSQLKGET